MWMAFDRPVTFWPPESQNSPEWNRRLECKKAGKYVPRKNAHGEARLGTFSIRRWFSGFLKRVGQNGR